MAKADRLYEFLGKMEIQGERDLASRRKLAFERRESYRLLRHGKLCDMKRDVAIVALTNNEGEIFMVRTHRFPEKWQPVGGGLEEGDVDPVAALIREVEEEVGLVLQADRCTHVTTLPFDFGEGSVYCYSYQLSDGAEMTIDTEEIIESKWLTITNVLGLPMYPATESFIKELVKLG